VTATRAAALILGGLVLALAACGGGGGGDGGEGGGSGRALGTEAVVTHTQIASGDQKEATTTLGITALRIRKGTPQELEQAGFELEDDQKDMTPYYVDMRYANKGSAAINRSIRPGLEDKDGNLVSAVTIFNFGGKPFAKCPANTDGEVAPGSTYESCTLFLFPQGKEPGRVSFLPYSPGKETEFIYWDAS
jgi:hypothetical protein